MNSMMKAPQPPPKTNRSSFKIPLLPDSITGKNIPNRYNSKSEDSSNRRKKWMPRSLRNMEEDVWEIVSPTAGHQAHIPTPPANPYTIKPGRPLRSSPNLCPNCQAMAATQENNDAQSEAPFLQFLKANLMQAAPRMGDITFVFTDIQSSTRMWNISTDAMRESLILHNDLLRQLIETWSGYEVKTEGDSFMIVFGESMNALEWCMEVQVNLMEVKWPKAILALPEASEEKQPNGQGWLWRGLRVRMGAHRGQALSERNPLTLRVDYFGPTVNRAARLAGHSHGGEILLSQSAYYACIQQLSANARASVMCLGPKPMRGFDPSEADNVYALTVHELRDRHFTWQEQEAPHPLDPAINVPSSSSIFPTNEAAVVFVEVTNSTVLWNELPDTMQAAMGLHKQNVSSMVSECGGRLVRVEGSACLIVFCAPNTAINFALKLQCKSVNTAWPITLLSSHYAREVHGNSVSSKCSNSCCTGGRYIWKGLKLRIGVHYGSVLTESDTSLGTVEYFGPSVNKALSIKNLAMGGQILVSQIIYALSDSALDVHTKKDLGPLSLDGFQGTTPIYAILPTCLQERRYNESKPSSVNFGLVEASPAQLTALKKTITTQYTPSEKLRQILEIRETERMQIEEALVEQLSNSERAALISQCHILDNHIKNQSELTKSSLKAQKRKASNPTILCFDDAGCIIPEKSVSSIPRRSPKPPTGRLRRQIQLQDQLDEAVRQVFGTSETPKQDLEKQLDDLKELTNKQSREIERLNQMLADLNNRNEPSKPKIGEAKSHLSLTDIPLNNNEYLVANMNEDQSRSGSYSPDDNSEMFRKKSKRIRQCRGCGQGIWKREDGIKAIDEAWHRDCFRCGECKMLLDSVFYVMEKQPFHHECRELRTKRNTEICVVCYESVDENNKVVSLDRSWHRACFKCGLCGEPLDPTIRPHYLDQLLYHQHCFSAIGDSQSPMKAAA